MGGGVKVDVAGDLMEDEVDGAGDAVAKMLLKLDV